MKQRILKFSVCEQRITTTDVSVVADSKNYLVAWFLFDNTWDGVAKTAVFSQGDKVYNMLLQDDMCRIPAEVITEGEFYVSVFGGDLITADKIAIEVVSSGLLEGSVPPVPTPDIYNQLVETVSAESAAAAASSERAEEVAQIAQGFSHEAQNAAEMANYSLGEIMKAEVNITENLRRAEQIREETEENASDANNAYFAAYENADRAFDAAARAESAAAELEWQTVLNVTLTAEQAGANTLLLELSDAAAVANARRMRLHIAFPQAAALDANKAWLAAILQDENGSKYTRNLIGGYNVAASAGTTLYSTAMVDISDFGLNSTYKRSYQSVFQLPNPHYAAPSNSVANARVMTGGYPSGLITSHQPYLKITIGSVTSFAAGTKIFMEVCK